MSELTLTPEQQIDLVNGASFFGTHEIPEKEIPRLQLLDGGTGINFEQLFGDFLSSEGLGGIGGDALRNVLRYYYEPQQLPDAQSKELHAWITERLRERFPEMIPPGCYPPGMMLAATWNPEVIYTVGEALGMEARSYGINVLLGTPNVNLHRDIRGGRLFEGYSEDPYLVSALAPALVRGVQSQNVAANVKHFAANHQETNRMNIDEHISERALYELYYPGFRACVEAGVATVMSAYNQINGVPCTENRAMLTDLLRKEWGFDGVVMSDWNAVYHPEKAVNAGNDLAMPGPIAPDALTSAYENGTLDRQALSLSAERVAALAKTYARPSHGTIIVDQTDRAAYDAAAEGIVLLRNVENTLPLDRHVTISLHGKHADTLLTCGEGSAGILTTRNISFLAALKERFTHVSISNENETADAMLYVYTLPGQEGRDRTEIGLPDEIQAEMADLCAEAERNSSKKILILNVSAPVALGNFAERFDAILCVFLPGMQGANALADCLCGKVNPSGKLPLTWPKRIQDMPTYLNFPGDGMQVQYGEGIFVGYRWYDARDIEPLYPFGHGLSYSEFSILSLKADSDVFKDSVTITAKIINKGPCAGKTVVQFYISDRESTLTKPVRELKAFRKISLAAGECLEVSVTLENSVFESYDPNLHRFTFEEGEYTIFAGFSSRDLQAECTVYADVRSPYSYGKDTSILIIMNHAQLHETVRTFFTEMQLPWSAILTSYEYTAQDTIGQILSQIGCSEECSVQLYERLSQIKKR